MTSLPLTPIVDVYYNLSPISAPRAEFNLGCIIGTSAVISPTTRGVVFQSTDEMIEYGFTSTSPEVLAAQVYFASSSRPKKVYVARQDNESTYSTIGYTGAIGNGNLVKIGSTTYTIGDGTEETTTVEDLLAVALEAGFTTASYVDSVLTLLYTAAEAGSEGILITLEVTKGEGPDVGTVETTIGTDAESPLDAVIAARAANTDWYACAFCEENTAEEDEAVAAYIESASIYSTYFLKSSSEAVFAGTAGNLFETLKGLKYNRTCGFATLKPYTHIASMAYALGQISDKANSSFTIALKGLNGTSVDALTSQQVTAVESNYGNVYINRGSFYDVVEKGTVFSGAYFDEIIQLDKLVNSIQLNVMDLLYQNPKIPQTEGGVSRIISTIVQANKNAVKTGFIAPGVWNGAPLLNLETGDYLPDGYVVQAESINEQSQADRDARKCPNIYNCIKLAGAIQSVVVEIDVNR